MLKVTYPAVICKECGSILKSEVYESFCDNCETKILGDPFDIDIFWKSGEDKTKTINLCSLECLKDFLIRFPYNIDEVEFITIPYIHNIKELQSFLIKDK